MSNIFTVTVSQVNRKIALMLKSDKSLSDVYVKGEISNFTHHYKSGHLYFSLKDEETTLKCVMFAGNAENLRFQPENGMNVIVRGGISVFERDGAYQLYASNIEPDGLGALYLAYEKLKNKLELEGLYTKKRPLPAQPLKICVITAKNGAALQDIISVLNRRYPVAELILISTLVQGREAPQSIVRSLMLSAKSGADVIIIARGGGSIEDLWAFNDEEVARAIYRSEIPTISAIGHETDFTIADFVADFRAPTPSAAAEIAVPDISVTKLALIEFENALKNLVINCINRKEKEISQVYTNIKAKSPENKIAGLENVLYKTINDIKKSVKSLVLSKEKSLQNMAELINVVSPINVLMRGYSIVLKEEATVKSTNDLVVGDRVELIFSEGKAVAEINELKN